METCSAEVIARWHCGHEYSLCVSWWFHYSIYTPRRVRFVSSWMFPWWVCPRSTVSTRVYKASFSFCHSVVSEVALRGLLHQCHNADVVATLACSIIQFNYSIYSFFFLMWKVFKIPECGSTGLQYVTEQTYRIINCRDQHDAQVKHSTWVFIDKNPSMVIFFIFTFFLQMCCFKYWSQVSWKSILENISRPRFKYGTNREHALRVRHLGSLFNRG